MTKPSSSYPTQFVLPDLVADCPYTSRLNPHCSEVARASERWLLRGTSFNSTRRYTFMGLKAGELTAACYPDADESHLRVCVDFMNYLFNLDDWLDEFDEHDTNAMGKYCIGTMRDPHNFKTEKMAGKMTKSFFVRMEQDAGPGCKERFIHTMDLFFKAVYQQAVDRKNGVVPDLESYIAMRRDTSGCKPCFALIEYAGRFDLPDEVVQHPVIQALEEATNDLVTWSNDLFSYNKEQCKGDTHNMISVMEQQGYTLQQAVNFVGNYSRNAIERFERERHNVPSWDAETDRHVAMYIDGLQNWIVGSLHWSFDSERYFGKKGQQVKKTRSIALLPKFGSPESLMKPYTPPVKRQKSQHNLRHQASSRSLRQS